MGMARDDDVLKLPKICGTMDVVVAVVIVKMLKTRAFCFPCLSEKATDECFEMSELNCDLEPTNCVRQEEMRKR